MVVTQSFASDTVVCSDELVCTHKRICALTLETVLREAFFLRCFQVHTHFPMSRLPFGASTLAIVAAMATILS